MITRNGNIQIENRTIDYYTKESIEWIDECTYIKKYIEINDPLISETEEKRLLSEEFKMEISKVIDNKTFEVSKIDLFWSSSAGIYHKID